MAWLNTDGVVLYSHLLDFVFLIVVILMNLLNGLAVSDTGLIMEQAEIVSYISRVETISHLESILLGDPFDFLTNWPSYTFLARLPAMALCYQVNLLILECVITILIIKIILIRSMSCAHVQGELDMLLLAPLVFYSSSGDLKK